MRIIRTLLGLAVGLTLAACGETQKHAPTPGDLDVLGPDADGRFYVVGLPGASAPGGTVRVSAVSVESATSNADGSFAVVVRGEILGGFQIRGGGISTTIHAASPEVVNINVATAKGLEALPGIGPVKAHRITKDRFHHGLFPDLDSLARVDGIGATIVANVSAFAEADININAAPHAHLMILPTIGDIRADAIIAWRNTNGPFPDVDTLLDVPGISETELEAVRPFVTAGDAPSDFPGSDLINVNTAGHDKLTELPQVGPARAAAIVDFRENTGAFFVKEDLMYVPGIGSGVFAAIRDRVTVGVFDIHLGTFLGDAATALYVDGTEAYQDVATDLIVTSSYGISASELIVTFIGGGACVESTECAPVALKGLLTETAGEFDLFGYLPAGDENGEFTVPSDGTSWGTVSESGLTISLTALRENESYRLDLDAGRVLQ